MLSGIDALLALQATGTVSEAAARLRLTQSAVSKRLKALATELGYPVIEADGRRVRLTTKGAAFLASAQPLVSAIRDLKWLSTPTPPRTLTVAIADSIAASWGPRLLRRSLAHAPEVRVAVHVHRSQLILERLRQGQYDLGIVSGRPAGRDLVWTRLVSEPLVLVGAGARSPVFTIEAASATWREVGPSVLRHPQLHDRTLLFVESCAAAVQMSKAGFGAALVPLGTARTLGDRRAGQMTLTPPLSRQIHLVSRKAVDGLDAVGQWKRALVTEARDPGLFHAAGRQHSAGRG